MDSWVGKMMMLKAKLGSATNALRKIMPFMDEIDDPQTSEDLKRTKGMSLILRRRRQKI